MSDSGHNYVCDITRIMRTRLACGLYNIRSIPPCLRIFARVYCVFVASVIFFFVYSLRNSWALLTWAYLIPRLGQYFLSVIVSLITEDEYIYKYFIQNKLTDLTLDSATVFQRLQKHLKYSYIAAMVFYFLMIGMGISIDGKIILAFWPIALGTYIIDFFVISTCSAKMLIMGLFRSRILILRRRLERYGFRAIGSSPPQPYCQIFDKIWKDIETTNNPLKLMLFFDLIFNCGILITYVCFVTYKWKMDKDPPVFTISSYFVVSLVQLVVHAFGHVALLESAAEHCEAMAVFTATQLIKTPTRSERTRMYQVLDALERRGASYRVLRALPFNANIVLSALGFCSAQALVLINMIVTK